MDDPTMAGAVAMGEEGGEAQQTAGYEICIKVGTDGAISVGVMPDGAETGEAGDPTALSPAKNIKEALSVALDIFNNAGQIPDAAGGNEEFDAGFGAKPAPGGAPAPMM